MAAPPGMHLRQREEPAFSAQQHGTGHAPSNQAAHPRAREGGDGIRRAAQDDRAGRKVLRHDDAERQKTVIADRQTFGDANLAAEEAAFADMRRARDPDLRGDEAMIADDAVMADVVAAPYDHVIADLRVGLDNVRFQYQAILADVRRIDVRIRVNERGELVIAALAFEVAGPPEFVHAPIAERSQQPDLLRWEKVFELFPG